MRFAQLSAVWAYSVSQPTFSFLRGNPEFLVLRDATRLDTIAFAVLLAFGPPLVALAYSGLAGLISRWVGDALFLALLAAFLVPFALQVAKPFDPSRSTALLAVLAICVVAIVTYVRWRAVRAFLAFSVVLPAAGLAWFVLGIPTTIDEAEAARVQIASRPPVVLVVLDELPVSSLLTRRGRIDAVRYPGFGRLAKDGTWYPNATSVHPFTVKAVPSILTGRMPRQGSLPTLKDHPENLFTLLGATYALSVREATTRLCPTNLCPRAAVSRLESVNVLFEDMRAPYFLKVLPTSITGAGEGAIPADGTFDRASDAAVQELETFIDSLSRASPRATLYYTHALLPHFPWRFLPSGREYAYPAQDHPGGRALRSTDPWLVKKLLQRHLVQLQYTDVLIGRLVRKLEQAGLYDQALVVVVADHGASFRPGLTLRDVRSEHIAEIASVPLFVKYPGQERGATDLRAARTVDVVPTIADVLGIRVPWHVAGGSLLGPPPQRTEVKMLDLYGEWVHAPLRQVKRQNMALVRRNTALFGEGRQSLYGIGAHRQLLGTPAGAGAAGSQTVRARIDNASDLANVRLSSRFIPAHISGTIDGGRIEAGTELAVAVNGRIRALTRCVNDGGGQRFGALVPERAFEEGFNLVEVFAIEDGPRRARLVRLGANRST